LLFFKNKLLCEPPYPQKQQHKKHKHTKKPLSNEARGRALLFVSLSPLFLAMLGDEVLACSLGTALLLFRFSWALVFSFLFANLSDNARTCVSRAFSQGCLFTPPPFHELLFYLLAPRLWCNNRIERIMAATHEYLVLIRPANMKKKQTPQKSKRT
jgi:hypothetical protein